MMVLGAGPGGYSAAFRAADLGMNTVLVERYAALGGVCLNVGCIPSKALLHVAAVIDETASMSGHGVTFARPEINVDELRAYKDKVIKTMTGGLAGMAKARKVTTCRASASSSIRSTSKWPARTARKKWCASRRRSSPPAPRW
jgi:dihydrolipoamide dehydrogenase